MVRDWQTLNLLDNVYVELGPLRADSRVLVQRSVAGGVSGFRPFVAVQDFQDIFYAWSNFRAGRKPTVEQGVRAVQYFDENDAYIRLDLEP
ncbi:MAG: hypothetical protein ACXWVM_34395 [Polyangiales bacterium]